LTSETGSREKSRATLAPCAAPVLRMTRAFTSACTRRRADCSAAALLGGTPAGDAARAPAVALAVEAVAAAAAAAFTSLVFTRKVTSH
jgi:hypothetical protein